MFLQLCPAAPQRDKTCRVFSLVEIHSSTRFKGASMLGDSFVERVFQRKGAHE